MERVAHIAVELLRVARQGDADAVMELTSSKHDSSKSSVDMKFSPSISVVHEYQHGIRVEQVSVSVSVSLCTFCQIMPRHSFAYSTCHVTPHLTLSSLLFHT